MKVVDNLLSFPASPQSDGREFSETLFGASGNLRVERIVSRGHTTPPGAWYDQEEDEWVAVLEGEARIAYPDGREVFLGKGDHLFLPRRVPHRVAYTSPLCVWLAVFGDIVPHAR
jgi:cupin 2 domain-containing protein